MVLEARLRSFKAVASVSAAAVASTFGTDKDLRKLLSAIGS